MKRDRVEATHRESKTSHRRRKRLRMLTVAAVITGAGLGIVMGRLANPNAPGTSAAKEFTSTGGVFTKVSAVSAPTWNLPDLARPAQSVSLSQFLGHPVIINFWASWCPPCRAEMPALQYASSQFTGKITFVGLDTQDEASAGLAFAHSRGVTYPLASDNAQVWSAYGVYGLPTTFFLSADGRIVGKQVGGMTLSRLQAIIHQVFERL
jgi:cytochrome c biogenesis protein CcmG/thiol:disulfide interchange protein DsbE